MSQKTKYTLITLEHIEGVEILEHFIRSQKLSFDQNGANSQNVWNKKVKVA